MAALRQTSFAAGELSPYLYGRTDLDLFRHGARQLLNFVVNRQGNAVSRLGTQWKVAAGQSTVRLVPMFTNAGQACVLEFGDQYVRIYDINGFILLQQFATEFRTADLSELQWAQAGDLLTVVHRKYAGFTLHAPIGTGLYSVWLFQPLSTRPHVIDSTGLVGMSPEFNYAVLLPSYMSAGGSFHAKPILLDNPPTTLFVTDAAHPPREWKYRVSTTFQHRDTGELRESTSSPITRYWTGVGPILPLPADNLLVLFRVGIDGVTPAPITIQVPTLEPSESTQYRDWVPVAINYYRGRSGNGTSIYGYVGSTDFVQDFKDLGDEPNYLIRPLMGLSPFSTVSPGPSAVAHFQQRLALAGGLATPSTWRTSALDAFECFDPSPITDPTQPLEVTLLGRKREEIMTMVAARHLVLFTDSSAWVIGRDDLPMQPETLPDATRLIDETGSTRLMPLVVAGHVLYVRANGRGVRALRPESGGFVPVDISWHAEHLFRGVDQQITSWCHQREPNGTVWAVTAAGILLSLTHTGDGGWAWARHETGGGFVRSVCCVPTAYGDEVFLAVDRAQPSVYVLGASSYEAFFPSPTGGTVIERMGEWAIGVGLPVDSAIISTQPAATADNVVSGLAHLEGREVWAYSPGLAPQGPFTVTGGSVTLAPWRDEVGDITVAIGLPYVCDIELLDASPGSSNQKTIVAVGFEIDQSNGISVGEDFEHLIEWENRTPDDNYEFPSNASAYAVVNVTGTWRKTGRAVLRQTKPLPVTVLGITRELAEGGK